jgi:hypothetical protein
MNFGPVQSHRFIACVFIDRPDAQEACATFITSVAGNLNVFIHLASYLKLQYVNANIGNERHVDGLSCRVLQNPHGSVQNQPGFKWSCPENMR